MTTVAQFQINKYQILNENSIVVDALPEWAKDPEVIKVLYGHMVLARTFDKKAIALQRTGKMGTYAPINGQEAISTAIGHAMRKEDVFIPYYRDYAAQFQRGVKMSEILSYWGGDERGSNYANNKEDLPICVPIASQCLHAAGIAYAFKYRKQKRVAVVTLGDGGTSEGDFYEALNVASAFKLPFVCIINNNYWAISVPLSQQTAAKTLAQKAIAAGMKSMQVDGNDLIACREIIGAAIEKARNGTPVLIEAITYRLSDHTTADDATRYQPPEEVEIARRNEPVLRLRKYMETQGFWNAELERQLAENCSQEIQTAVDEYLARERQPVSAIFDYHFAELPDYLVEQRAIAMEEAMEEEKNA